MTPPPAEVLTLPFEIYSPDQLSGLLLEARDVASALRQKAALAKASGKPAHQADLVVSEGLEKLAGSISVESVERVVKGLELLRNTVPTVRLVFAAQPNRQLKAQLVKWFRNEIHPQVLIVFVVRSDIAGGIVVQTVGHVYDFSFKRQLIGAKHRIAELLHV